MAHTCSAPSRVESGKKVLAGMLMAVMVLSMGSTLHWVYEESSAVCDQVAKEPLAMGATQLPCRATRISASGRSETRFFYGRSGQLIAVEEKDFDEDVQGVSCSLLGKQTSFEVR